LFFMLRARVVCGVLTAAGENFTFIQTVNYAGNMKKLLPVSAGGGLKREILFDRMMAVKIQE